MSDTTAKLERDAEIARANLADTAESIRNKMTPGQLIDEFASIFSGGDGVAALGNLKTQIRDNPLPVTLIGTGLAWLVLGPGVSGSASSKGAVSREAWDKEGSPFGEQDPASSNDLGGSIGDIISEAKHNAGSIATEAKDAVRDSLNDGARKFKAAVGSATSSGTDVVAKGRRSASEILEAEPLILAALGLGVGAAIGAMLPQTKIEEERLGHYADALRTGAQDFIEKGVEGAKEVAAEAYQAVKDEADRQASTGIEAASVVEKVGKVVRTASSKTEQSVREKLSSAPDQDNAGT